MFEIIQDENGINSINVNNTFLDSDDGESWFAPKDIFKNVKISDLPESIEFELCQSCSNNSVTLDSIPTKIKRIGGNKILISFDDTGTRKYWDGEIGFSLFMETKKKIIQEREINEKDLKLDDYDDDGAFISLLFSTEYECEEFEDAISHAEQIVNEIEGSAELILNNKIYKIDDTKDEKDFTLRVVIPILRKLGFINVKYTHGIREYGKDIVFSRITEFDELEHWVAQVKHGDISGGANSEIDSIVGQADDSFKMPYYDLYTKSQVRPSKLCIIISGKFTENAIHKICEKIESNAEKNNMIFIDGEKIENLIEKIKK